MKSFTTTFSQYIKPTDTIILAVSGGVDSMVLLDLVSKNHPKDKIVVGHFDHSLRGAESDGDRELVEQVVNEMGIVFEYEKKDIGAIAKSEKSSLEAVARRERYAFLERVLVEHQAEYILTAHHRDDQAETVLMNLIKGGKVYGLSGMGVISRTSFVKGDKGDFVSEKNPQSSPSLQTAPLQKELTGTIFRPLLSVSKSDIREYASDNHIDYREDSSNHDTDYDRNKIRQDIMPLMCNMNPSIDEGLAELALYMQGLSEFMDSRIARWFAHATAESGKDYSFLTPTFASESVFFQKEIVAYLYRDAHRGSTQGLSRGNIDEILRFILVPSNSHGIKEVKNLKLERRGERIYYK